MLVVDIGGGVGHDLLGFRARHPYLKGRLVLEELPHVIDQVADKLEGFELLKHDFHTLPADQRYVPTNSSVLRCTNTSNRSPCILPPPDLTRLLRRYLPQDLAADQACHAAGQVQDLDQRAGTAQPRRSLDYHWFRLRSFDVLGCARADGEGVQRLVRIRGVGGAGYLEAFTGIR